MQSILNPPLPFENLSKPLQTMINEKAEVLILKKGEDSFLSEEFMKYVYVIQKGKLKSYQLNLDTGKEQILYIYKNNMIVDTITILDGEEHDVCYEVLEDCKVMVLSISFIRELLYNYPEFSQKFFLYISKQMRYLEEMLTDISLYSTSERLIKLIIQDYNKENLFRFNILEGLSHSETAKLLGTVRHVVERHLKELKRDNLIDVVKRKIQIKDANLLLDKIHLLT